MAPTAWSCSILFSVVEAPTSNSPALFELNILLAQQGSLHVQSALIATETSVRPDGAVTRHDKGEWIVRQCVAYGSGSAGYTQILSDEFVGTDVPSRYRVFRAKNLLLELPTHTEVRSIKTEVDRFSIKKPAYG